MRDRETRVFIGFALAIALVGWTLGYGIKAAVILWPEPLPKLSMKTDSAIWVGWQGDRQLQQMQMLMELDEQTQRIWERAELLTFGILKDTPCGRYQAPF